IRAFESVLYYKAKLELAEKTIRLNQDTAAEVRKLVNLGTLRPQDEILALSELQTTRAALELARSSELRARQDLRRAIGLTVDSVDVQGTLKEKSAPADPTKLLSEALQRRPDLHARQDGIREADARLRLAQADRYGNPNIGPDYEYNETRDNFIG